MFNKAIIEKRIDAYNYKVRIPRYNKTSYSSFSTDADDLYEAIVCITPGVFPVYDIGDIVFVQFENDQLNQPVIVGKLYREDDDSESTCDIECLSVDSESIPKPNPDFYDAVDYIIENGGGGGSSSGEHKKVTQDEYDNLPVSEQMSDTVFFITDTNSSVTDYVSDYSETSIAEPNDSDKFLFTSDTTSHVVTLQNLKQIFTKASKYTITLSVDGWEDNTAYYTQRIRIASITEDMNFICAADPDYDADQATQKAYYDAFSIICSGAAIVHNGSITFKVYKQPQTTINVILKGV